MKTETKAIKNMDSKGIKRIARFIMSERFDLEETADYPTAQWSMIQDAIIAGIKHALDVQHDRIAELEAQLSAYQISKNQRLDAIPSPPGSDATCPDCGTVYNPVDYWCCPACRGGDQFATGQDYAEGCAP